MEDNIAKAAAEKAKWHRQHLVSLLLLTRRGRNTSSYTHKNLEKKTRNMLNANRDARRAAKAAKKAEPQILPVEPPWRNAVENTLLSTHTKRKTRRSRRRRH